MLPPVSKGPAPLAAANARATPPPQPNPDPAPTDVVELQRENARLRGEVEQLRAAAAPARGTVSFNVEDNRLVLNGVGNQGLSIDRLQARVDGAGAMVKKAFDPAVLLGDHGLPDLEALRHTPMVVDDARLRISQQTATGFILRTQGPLLEKEGIKLADVRFLDGDRIAVQGTVRKFINIPFDLEGRLQCTGPRTVRLDLDQVTVGGLLPVPQLVTRLLTSLSEDALQRARVKGDGQSFEVDVSALVPPNVQADLKRIGTDKGYLVIEAGRPAPPSAPPRNPTTLTME